jgi:hypothetical protein
MLPFMLLVVGTVLEHILLCVEIAKLRNEIIKKDLLISAFMALDESIKKLNDGFKDHEHRLNNVEELLLSEKPKGK